MGGDNRPKSEKSITKYVKEILNGRWVAEVPIIRMDNNNQILDGQNRFWSVIRANVAIVMRIERGHNPDHFFAFDANKPRTYTDTAAAIKIKG